MGTKDEDATCRVCPNSTSVTSIAKNFCIKRSTRVCHLRRLYGRPLAWCNKYLSSWHFFLSCSFIAAIDWKKCSSKELYWQATKMGWESSANLTRQITMVSLLIRHGYCICRSRKLTVNLTQCQTLTFDSNCVFAKAHLLSQALTRKRTINKLAVKFTLSITCMADPQSFIFILWIVIVILF